MSADSVQGGFALDVQGLDRLKRGAARDPGGALRETAEQFESLFLHRMIKAMRDAVPRADLLDSSQTRFYESLFDQQISQHLAGRGVGLAEQLVAQLSERAGTPRVLPGVSRPEGAAAVPARQEAASGQAGGGDRAARAEAAQARPPLLAAANPPASKTPATPEAFVDQLFGPALDAERRTGVPAPLILAQAALETGWGRHRITTEDGADSHNLFAIKAGSSWRGKTTDITTHEYIDGQRVKRVERFRVYDSYQDAFADHGRLLTGNGRYAGVLRADSADQAARALQDGGYATDPSYADKLVSVMDRIGSITAGKERLLAAQSTPANAGR